MGLLIISLNPTSINVQNIILGNILGIADEDIYQVAIIMLICLVLLLIFWKDLLLIFFDETQAITVGLSPLFYKVLFFTLLSACVVAALQTVGAILVIAMVITPGATAYLLTDKFKTLQNCGSIRHNHGFCRCLFKLLSGWRNRWCHRDITNLVIFISFSILAEIRINESKTT